MYSHPIALLDQNMMIFNFYGNLRGTQDKIHNKQMLRIQNQYFPTLPTIQANKSPFIERIGNKQTLDNKTKRRCLIYLSMRSDRFHLF